MDGLKCGLSLVCADSKCYFRCVSTFRSWRCVSCMLFCRGLVMFVNCFLKAYMVFVFLVLLFLISTTHVNLNLSWTEISINLLEALDFDDSQHSAGVESESYQTTSVKASRNTFWQATFHWLRAPLNAMKDLLVRSRVVLCSVSVVAASTLLL